MQTLIRAVLRLAAFAVAPALVIPAAAIAEPQVTIALLPNGTNVADLRAVPDLSPGLLSAGINDVVPEQTYLDVTQGNRTFESLYHGDLPDLRLRGGRVEGWGKVVERARSAPADVVPGLLASTLAGAGRPMTAAGSLGAGALLAADRSGRVVSSARCSALHCDPAVVVRSATRSELPRLVSLLRGGDMLVVLERPPPGDNGQLTLAIAGAGFHGDLTSDSTRMDGYVVSTDLAPTILRRLRIAVPSEMSGEQIRAEGEPDFTAVADRGARLQVIPERRGPVVGVSVLVWLLGTALATGIWRRRGARLALRLLALSLVLMPALLLVGAAIRPSEGVERLIVLLGAPAGALVALRLLSAYRALALACAVTVLAEAIDVIAGSPLTALSLAGPNPGLGVRFYGIGNELEAILAAVTIFGTGAAITGFAPRMAPRRAATIFVAVTIVFAFVFAVGRFGADVGAAIVLPIGGAAAAAVLLGAGRWALLWILAAPFLALAALAVIDLASGGNAHLTRSVLDAGGLHDLADVAERRLRLSEKSFGRGLTPAVLALVIAASVLAFRNRDRLLSLFDRNPSLRAGLIGTLAATAAGTLANDSGALLLELGAAYLLAFTGFAWATRGNRAREEV